jgi:hypothetical protein
MYSKKAAVFLKNESKFAGSTGFEVSVDFKFNVIVHALVPSRSGS